ncbi:MAG: uroporphyrinogen-III synthase [Deltaproteobacteria bacterium]
MSERPPRLDGRRVAVTRGKGGDDPLAARLRELGAEVIPAPAISVAPPSSWSELDQALRELGRFEWIVFASATAVDMCLDRIAALSLPPPGPETRLAAVGQATAGRLAERLRPPDLVPGQATGEGLAAALAPHARGRRVLVPRAEGGRPELVDGLAAAGALVRAVPCYRTLPAAPAEVSLLGDALAAGGVDAVAFASPSAVRSVVAALGARAALLERCAIAAIGPTTAAAVREYGLRVAVTPGEASAVALADAIAAHLGPRR